MRNVETVKETRDSLRSEFVEFMNMKHTLQKHKADMDEYEKKLFGYVLKTVEILNSQINCLEFVLNEDTPMENAINDTHYKRTYNIDKASAKEKMIEFMTK